jgi:endonuclease/exonuclease/phosphatase (EEP) superfamily protein YafD
MNDLLTTLRKIIQSNNEHEPMIILGDFNEGFLINGTCTLMQLMNDHNFYQFVQDPTTDRATMIDLIFARNVHPHNVGCYDIYYSDHDAVCCTITVM